MLTIRTFLLYILLLLGCVSRGWRNPNAIVLQTSYLIPKLYGQTRSEDLSTFSLEIAQQYMQYNYGKLIETFQQLTDSELCQIYSNIPRNAFNIGLKPRLRTSSLSESSKLLASLCRKHPKRVAPDTFNTFLSDALFTKANFSHGKWLFSYYVEQKRQFLPTSRTFNHLLEAARLEESDRDLQYYFTKMTESYNLLPDAATFATVIRSYQSPEQILEAYYKARDCHLVNPILFRCILESLGNVALSGTSSHDLLEEIVSMVLTESVSVKTVHNPFKNTTNIDGINIFHSALTGDSFVAALISIESIPNPFLPYFSSLPTSSSPSSSHFLHYLTKKTTLQGLDIILLLLIYGWPESIYYDPSLRPFPQLYQLLKYHLHHHSSPLSSQLQRLQLTAKGYCILFGYLQRKVRYNLQNVFDLFSPPRVELEEQYLFVLQTLLTSYQNQVLLPAIPALNTTTMPTNTAMTMASATKVENYQTSNILLNHKIIDAILRAYGISFMHALTCWKTFISRYIYQLYAPYPSQPASNDFLYCLVTGYATLMSIAGYHNKPEYALSIARGFTKISALFPTKEASQVWAQELWHQYLSGKRSFIKDYEQQYGNRYTPFVNHLLAIGTENTIQLELQIFSTASSSTTTSYGSVEGNNPFGISTREEKKSIPKEKSIKIPTPWNMFQLPIREGKSSSTLPSSPSSSTTITTMTTTATEGIERNSSSPMKKRLKRSSTLSMTTTLSSLSAATGKKAAVRSREGNQTSITSSTSSNNSNSHRHRSTSNLSSDVTKTSTPLQAPLQTTITTSDHRSQELSMDNHPPLFGPL